MQHVDEKDGVLTDDSRAAGGEVMVQSRQIRILPYCL
jgi:hypothetical protein